MNENCCLCKCFTELYFFYWLLVVSCNFNRFAVCFQSFINNACRSTQNAARIKRFLRLHIVIKPLNKKIKKTNSLLCWSVTLLMFTANLARVKVSMGDFGSVWTVSLKAHDWSCWILSECNLSWKIVKYCSLSEVCMINSIVIFLDFHSTKQELPLVDSWSRGLD